MKLLDHPVQPSIREETTLGLPETVALSFKDEELLAPWHSRLPFAFQLTWQVRTAAPCGGGEWAVDGLLGFDRQGRLVKRWNFADAAERPMTVWVYGPMAPPDDKPSDPRWAILDPHQGDRLDVTINLPSLED
jgi:hypothetical protein